MTKVENNDSLPLHKRIAHYCPFYCEENIWHLASELTSEGKQVQVIFISNHSQQVALWLQRYSQQGTGTTPVVWDYHVVLATFDDQKLWQIWDPDSQLNTPITAIDYLQQTFPSLPHEHADFAPLFRYLDAKMFLRSFASDRRHMLFPNGEWISPPPSWPAITSASFDTHNLDQYCDMSEPFLGEVVPLRQLMDKMRSTHGT